ncbi:MAG TPA: nuclease-related domain-containing protein [Flavobacterium sp.]|nr:nuclease-related domain-containing protein [Flavobacterium sp.]
MYVILFSSVCLAVAAIGFILYRQRQNTKAIQTVTERHRGTSSERELVLQLLRMGFRNTAIFHDLYIRNRNGTYTQIDLVLATDVGILVFEVKEYSGWIFGTGTQRNWTQVMGYGRYKYPFYNPVFQNRKHVSDLRDQLPQFRDIPFYSIVVFYGNCQFVKVKEIPFDTFLVKWHEVANVINGIVASGKSAPYKDKWEVAHFLAAAARNGADHQIVQEHVINVTQWRRQFGSGG